MKSKIIVMALMVATALISACSNRSYNVKRSNHTTSVKELIAPPGMVYVPAGTVMLGAGGDSTDLKRYRLSAFYIDKTAITNKQYRQFVYWVRDSIAITDHLKDKQYFTRTRTRYKDSTVRANINWDKVGDGSPIWKSRNFKTQEKLQGMYSNNELNTSMLNYSFELPLASKTKDRKTSSELVNVWPDETVWEQDFPNSQNDLMTKSFFTHPSFDDYPVVGVSWKQARAFAAWRSKIWKSYNYKMKNPKLISLPMDLPTEAQRAYVDVLPIQTKEVVLIDTATGKKTKVKQVSEVQLGQENLTYVKPAMLNSPNQFGLYNTNGNVAEWTLNTFTNSWQAFVHPINPILLYDANDNEDDDLKRKVVYGTSWKDDPNSKASKRSAELQDQSKSFIGFRCVMLAPETTTEKSKTSK